MQFDEFYETVGVFGTYQKIKYFLLCFTNMLPPVMVYAWSFIAATPSFSCKSSDNSFFSTNLTSEYSYSYMPSESQCYESQKKISLKECQRCFQFVNISNNDGAFSELRRCTRFKFDHTYYRSTLVEDVSRFWIYRN